MRIIANNDHIKLGENVLQDIEDNDEFCFYDRCSNS